MARLTAFTRQPPAGDPKGTLRADDLPRTLREGDRDAFVRYFRLFRAPVYHFAWRLLRDDAAASGATRDALTAAFRRAILDDEVTDLETLTFRCALEACEARPGPAPVIPEGERPDSPGVSRGSGGPEEDAARQRFEAALDSLEPRQRAALLLHDLQGMDAARSAVVLRLGAEAAGALLFRAREEFREALHGRPGYGDGRKCRQAEEALAGAVGLGLDDDGLARLRRHAGYCRPCRKVMKTWTAAGVGLATVLMPPPLPESLAAAPVFGDVVGGATPDAGRTRLGVLLPLPLARTGRALRGRAAAWVVAAACLALAGGLSVHVLGLRPVVLMQSVGPAIRLIVAAPPDGSEPAAARGAGRETTSTTAPAIGISGDGATGPAAASSAGPAQPGATLDGTAPPGEAPPADGSQSGTRDAPPGTEEPGQSAASAADRRADGRPAADSGKTAKARAKADDKAAKADDKAAKADDKAAKADDKAAKASGKAAKASGKSNGKAAKASGKSNGKAAKASGKSAKASGKSAKSSGKAAKASDKAVKSDRKATKADGKKSGKKSGGGGKKAD